MIRGIVGMKYRYITGRDNYGKFIQIIKKCRECPFKEKRSKKRMEAEGYLPEPMLASATMPSTEELAAPILRKHDYRDVKVAEGMTITIDLEELKEQMKQDFYKSVGIGLHFGA